jgi:bifunctional DNA-binding transcriptional regulator/antitoxin component of YhaV-PrlF toxin-antitoxin module
MEEIITMDSSGRIVVPKKIRQKFPTNRFLVNSDGEKIELKPMKSLDALFGAVPELDLKKIRKEHEREVSKEHF